MSRARLLLDTLPARAEAVDAFGVVVAAGVVAQVVDAIVVVGVVGVAGGAGVAVGGDRAGELADVHVGPLGRAADVVGAHHRILALGGVVASRNAEVGDVINPLMGGFSPSSGVLTLMDFSRVKIEIEVSSQDIARVKKGLTALLRVDAYPDRSFPGRVSIVNQTADPMTRKFRVQIVANNPELELRPNTFGEVTLEISTHEDALIVPNRAVRWVNGEQVIYLSPDGEEAVMENLVRTPIILGASSDEYTEILEGDIQIGDYIVLNPPSVSIFEEMEHRRPGPGF